MYTLHSFSGSDTVTVTREMKDKYAHQIFETREV